MKRNPTQASDRPAIAVNENLAIEVSQDEILADLLYPATRVETAR